MRISDWSSDVCSSDLPQRKIGGVELAPEQYARYVYLAGAPAKAYLDAYVISPGWQGLSDPLKARVIRKTTELFRRGAKTQMLVAHPELREAESENQIGRAHGWNPVTYAPHVCRLLLEQ